MRKYIFYVLFGAVPALFMYLHTLYRMSLEDLFRRNELTGFNLIGHILLPIVIAAVLIVLALYSLRFSKTKSFYILLIVLFISYLALSILPLYSSVFSLQTTTVGPYIINELPWYAGYYGGTLLFGYLYSRKENE